MTQEDNQHRIETPGPLLGPDGTLTERGWATDLILRYERERIRASALRMKEWDYYCILGSDYGVAFTVADNGYLGFVSVTVLDLRARTEETKTIMTAFPRGSFRMPPSSKTGDVIFRKGDLELAFQKSSGRRTIRVEMPSFSGGLRGTIELAQPEEMETMVIATPFSESRRAFYYNQKINCMPAAGELRFGSRTFAFDPADSFGVLDWGRGVWSYSNRWYWGSASGRIGGSSFGFNVGYGFGDTAAASENTLFYEGRAHKLSRVEFHIPEPEYLKPWSFTSSDGRFEMDFFPLLDRFSDTNLLLLRSWQHQVFGRFTGRAILDDGTRFEIKELLGFAEKVENRW